MDITVILAEILLEWVVLLVVVMALEKPLALTAESA